MTRPASLVLAALLLCLGAAHAADFGEPIFHSVGDLATIPNGIVSDITQDKAGFLWIATHDGLVRYDGYEFRLFRHDDKDPHSLAANRIRAMEAGDDGRLWLATATGGVSVYDPATERFRTVSTAGSRALARGKGGMWLVSTEGLYFADYGTLKLRRVDAAPPNAADKAKRNDVGSVLPDRRGNFWIGSVVGLSVQRPNGVIEQTALQGKPVYRIFETAGGALWIATFGGGLHILDPATGQLQEIDKETRAYTIIQPSANEIWIGTPGDGIEVRDARTGALLRRIRHDASIAETIDSDRVNALFIDRSGIVWIGTWGDGVNRYNPADAAFRLLRYSPERADGLTHRDIGSIFEDAGGRIWIGTRGNGADVFEDGKRAENIRDLADLHVPAITETSDGAIWLGTREGAIHRYDRATRAIRRYPIRSVSDTTSTIAALEPAKDGGVWIGMTGGLVHLDPKTGAVTPQRFTDGKPVKSAVTKIVYDRDGVLWAGTHTALAALVPGAKAFERIKGTGSDFIQDLLVDSKGRLWAGTSEGLDRLIRFDGKRASFEAIGPRIGRDGLRCENLLEDKRGRIWVDGDLMFDPQTLAHREFTAAEGAGRVIWNGAAAKLRDGRLLYGGPEGVLVIDPELVRDWKYAPPVAVTAVRVDGHRRTPGASLVLEPGMKSISFEFAALDFSAPQRNKYAYRLRGFESAWISVDATRRLATYTNLPPGEYTLEVRGSNRLGAFNQVSLGVPLRVRPAWYQTTLFRIAVVLALLGATYPIYRIRLRLLQRRQRALEELVRARTAELEVSERRALEASQAKSIFLATMSHELRTPLNAILGFSQLMRRSPSLSETDRQTVSVIRRSGEHLLGLINDVLSIAKIEAGKLVLERRPFDAREMIATVEEMMSVRAEAAQVRFTVDVDASFPPVVEGDEGKLRQVLINLLGNAIKFASKGAVTLRARWENGRAHFEVLDTGAGIAAEELPALFEPFVQTTSGRKSKEGTGLGLTVTKHIVEGMGGGISVESTAGKGTTFRFDVELPASTEIAAAAKSRVVGLAEGEHARRILVADDTVENRTLLRNLLELTGFEVREASNGSEALDVWAEWQPELIFMDVRMPIVDGREAIRRIRAGENAGTRVPIVALTASVFEHERTALLDGGADQFLMKPFREEAIFDVLTRHVGVRFRYEEEEAPAPRRTLPGLDVDEGVRRASGNVDLYARLVESFRRDHQRAVPRLEALLDAGAHEEALTLLHTLKGSAATIGARRLAEAAARAEEGGAIDELRSAFDEFAASATQLHARQTAAAPSPFAPERARLLIGQLGTLLAENNLAAVERFDELRGLFGARSSESLTRMQSAIDRLDFQQALGELPRLEREVAHS